MTDTPTQDVFAAILAGGRGERLWPLTRLARPKPLLRLDGDGNGNGNDSLLGQAIARLEAAGIPRNRQRIVSELRHATALRQDSPDVELLLEPRGFNTAHSVALAALAAAREAPDPILVVVPSDHVIREPGPLVAAIADGIACARSARRLTVFGVAPTGASTAYGHLRAGARLGAGPASALTEYVEKPVPERAAQMSASGAYLWNCGNFVFPVRELLDAFRRFQPEILAAATAIDTILRASPDKLATAEQAYAAGPHVSVDHAIMEPAAAANLCAVIPVDLKRIDAGNLDSLGALFPADAQGNTASGPALFLDSQGCFSTTKGPLVAVLGLQNVVVTVENDVVLVCHRDRAGDVRPVLAALKTRSRGDLL